MKAEEVKEVKEVKEAKEKAIGCLRGDGVDFDRDRVAFTFAPLGEPGREGFSETLGFHA